MNNTRKCPTCKGFKIVSSMGGMNKECNECNGVGFIISYDRPNINRMIRRTKKKKLKKNHPIYKLKDNIKEANQSDIQTNNELNNIEPINDVSNVFNDGHSMNV